LTAAGKLPEDKVKVMVITLDPWRDTPGALPGLAKSWDFPDNAHLLSGDVDDVNNALDRYNVARGRDNKDGQITHPPLVYIVDDEGNIAYTLNNPSTRWLAEAAERII